MKDCLRFVDSDMHVREPPDLFDGGPNRGPAGAILIDGEPTSDADFQQYRKRLRSGKTRVVSPLSGSRLQETDQLDFAIDRDYNAEAQVMEMEIEGVDIAVLYPTMGLGLLGRNGIDPRLSLAVCQAYNNWISFLPTLSQRHIVCRTRLEGLQ